MNRWLFTLHFYILCPVLVAKNHHKIRSRCLVHEFSFTDIFNNINHGYRTAIVKKIYLWLVPFSMAVATYCYYENYIAPSYDPGNVCRSNIERYSLKFVPDRFETQDMCVEAVHI